MYLSIFNNVRRIFYKFTIGNYFLWNIFLVMSIVFCAHMRADSATVTLPYNVLTKKGVWDCVMCIFGHNKDSENEQLKQENAALQQMLIEVLSTYSYITMKNEEKKRVIDRIACGIAQLLVYKNRYINEEMSLLLGCINTKKKDVNAIK